MNDFNQCGEIIKQVNSLHSQGHKDILVTFHDGRKLKKRLFVGGYGMLCVFKTSSRTRGYPLSTTLVHDWKAVQPLRKKIKEDSIFDWFIRNLEKYRKAFTERVHPNLWTEHQADYERFSMEAFIAYTEGAQTNRESYSDLYEALREYCNLFDIKHIVFENRYKNFTIRSIPPDRYTSKVQFNACILGLQQHLDNREDFHYHWKSRYDVTVSGKVGPDGIYRAWMSLEYANKGNGHYYLLINNNSAVFSEDD